MRKIFVDPIEKDLDEYKECAEEHIPNGVTEKALVDSKTKRGLYKADSIEALFKKLGE